MKEVLLIISFLLWYVLAIIIADKTGKKNRISEEWAFFISFMFSPLVGLLVYYFTGKKAR